MQLRFSELLTHRAKLDAGKYSIIDNNRGDHMYDGFGPGTGDEILSLQ